MFGALQVRFSVSWRGRLLHAGDRKSKMALMDDESFLQAKNEDTVKVNFHIRRIHSHTCQCCGIMCSLWAVTFIGLVVLSLTVGTIEFDIGVPFYDREEINQKAMAVAQCSEFRHTKC